MPDPIARKRLKKKMLERWENEGGRIAADQSADQTGATSEHKDKSKRLSGSRNDSTADSPASSTKRRKSIGK